MKKVIGKLAVVCAGALVATSCGSGKQALSLSSLNGEWNITEVDGRKLAAEEPPFIGFDVDQKRIYGNSGCNRMMGTFEADSLKPGVLSFGQIGSTRMMCPDMETETAVLGALEKVKKYETLSAGQPEVIALSTEDGQQLLKLEKRQK